MSDDNLAQPPGSIIPNFDAHINMIGSESRAFGRGWTIMNMTVKINPTLFKRDNRTMRKDNLYAFTKLKLNWSIINSHTAGFIPGSAQSVMITANQYHFSIQHFRKDIKIAFLTKCKITQMKNGILWGNTGIPVIDNQFLPVFGAITVSSNIDMEEMCVRNDPGVGSNYERVVGSHPLMQRSKSYYKLQSDLNVIGNDRTGSSLQVVLLAS